MYKAPDTNFLTIAQAETLEVLIAKFGVGNNIDLSVHYGDKTNYHNGLRIAVRTLKRKNLVKEFKDIGGEIIRVTNEGVVALDDWAKTWSENNEDEPYPWNRVINQQC